MRVSCTLLAAPEAVRLAGGVERPVILDGTLDLAEARWDGDYRATSGTGRWAARHIPGSQHIDLLTQWVDRERSNHFAAPTPAGLASELGQAGIDGGRPVLVYDRSNSIWAARLWWTLRNAGIAAAVIDGGLAAWERAGGRVEAGPPPAVAAPMAPPPVRDLGLWVERGEVEAIVAGTHPGRPALVCALSAESMWGAVPTRYTRRGHIPGSLNLAARSLLTKRATMLDGPGPLAVSRGELDPARPVVVYCGGGISASLSALALVHWGFEQVRIYDGSLEEWSADPRLPLVTAPATEAIGHTP